MVKTPVRQPLFIVGMYKSGTSWLLRVLDHHPRLRGVKEIDLIGAGAGKVVNGDTLLTPKERLISYFSANAWSALPNNLAGNIRANSILMRNTGSESISSIFDLPAEKAIDTILGLYAVKSKHISQDWAPNETQRLLSVIDVPHASLSELYNRIAGAGSVYEAADAFLDTVYQGMDDRSNLVLKGADMIARYAYLQKWKPNSKKILIVRDGRDAAISAMHYRRLMRSVKRANVHDEDDYWALIKAWCNRVNILMSMASDKNLVILRYEDLMLSFTKTVAAMFTRLDLAYDESLLDVIHKATSFETLTDRKPGESAQHLMRRGMTGEWREVLSPADAKKAWQQAEKELSFLGYTESGNYEQLNITGALHG